MDEPYANIRDLDQLGTLIGRRVVDITQHDQEEWEETQQAYIMLHFDNGTTVKFYVDDAGFDVHTID